MSAPSEHALLSASGAERWLMCPPSARLEEQFPEESSSYAEEGRHAHALAELKLRKYFTTELGPSKYKAELKLLKDNPIFTPEMDAATDEHLRYVKGIAARYPAVPYVALEQRVLYDDVAPEGFGTADCTLVYAADIHVIDLKYGKGVFVDAVENWQLLFYAWGAYRKYRMLSDIKEVHLHISQPRLERASSEWVISVDELKMRMDYARPIAALAFAGGGEYMQGEHCKFCRARRRCAARTAFCLEIEPLTQKTPNLLTNAEIGSALGRVMAIQSWLSDVSDFVTSLLLDGVEVPGWKLVEGRGTRVWTDSEKAFDILRSSGYDDSILFERVPLSLAKIEGIVGKKNFGNLMSNFVQKTKGKPTLVDESDPREVYKKDDAATVFSEN